MSGREGRVQALSDAVATASLEGSVYSLADQSFSPVVITGPKRTSPKIICREKLSQSLN
jgi:hypothetical protein